MFLLSPFMRLFCVCSTNMKLNNIQKLAEALVDNSRADIDKKEADIADRTYRADWADSFKKTETITERLT